MMGGLVQEIRGSRLASWLMVLVVLSAAMSVMSCGGENDSYLVYRQPPALTQQALEPVSEWSTKSHHLVLSDEWCQSAEIGATHRGYRSNTRAMIREVALNQGVAHTIFRDGQDVQSDTPLIVQRRGLLSVYLEDLDTPLEREGARLTIRQKTGEVEVFDALERESLGREEQESGFHFRLPARVFGESSEFSIQLFEYGICNDRLGLRSARFPMKGNYELSLKHVGELELVLVPIRYEADGSGRLPDYEDEDLEVLRGMVEAMFPVPRLSVKIHEIVSTDEAELAGILSQLLHLRDAERAGANVAYFGLVNPAESMEDYCGASCVAGVSALGAPSGEASAGVGIGFRGSAHETLLHELGHIYRLDHSPCGGPSGQDPEFPYEDGSIGSWGYDYRSDLLIDPQGGRRDLMSYCDPTWISDYHYKMLADRIQLSNSLGLLDLGSSTQSAQHSSLQDSARQWRTLLVSEGTIRWTSAQSLPGLPQGESVNLQLRFVDESSPATSIQGVQLQLSEDLGQMFSIPEESLAGVQAVQLPSGAWVPVESASLSFGFH
ncbi:MAG: M66 family metalloprotease [Polyangiaceae bacterium]|nr:M66 family metalloprotease [Polyangiaceae bacterium]